jgi:hypothetical protein
MAPASSFSSHILMKNPPIARFPTMKTRLLDLDPEADTELYLYEPNSHKATKPTGSPESERPEQENHEGSNDTTPPVAPHEHATSAFSSEPNTVEELRELRPRSEQSPQYPESIVFRVSSRHLTLASKVFKAMITGPFKESTRTSDGLYNISTREWDAEALLIVLRRIHGHHRLVPKCIEFETLKQVSIIVDYYGCHDAMYGIADKWIDKIRGNMELEQNDVLATKVPLPMSYCDELLTWLFIGQVWSHKVIIDSTSYWAMFSSESKIETDLPISSNSLGECKIRTSVN